MILAFRVDSSINILLIILILVKRIHSILSAACFGKSYFTSFILVIWNGGNRVVMGV